LALGLFCVYHGFLKIKVDGGASWTTTLPAAWQFLLAWSELVAGLAILFGYRCRAAAAVVLAITTGTLIWWQGWNIFKLPLHNLEPTILLILIGLALVFLGAGELSVDGRAAVGSKSSFRRK